MKKKKERMKENIFFSGQYIYLSDFVCLAHGLIQLTFLLETGTVSVMPKTIFSALMLLN